MKSVLSIILVLVIVSGILLVNQVKQVHVQEVHLFGVQGIGSSQPNLTGVIIANNSGRVNVPVDHIDYSLSLENNNQTLANGTVNGTDIIALNLTAIPITIRLPSSVSLTNNILLQEHVYANIDGKIYIGWPIVQSFGIPFHTKADLKEYLARTKR